MRRKLYRQAKKKNNNNNVTKLFVIFAFVNYYLWRYFSYRDHVQAPRSTYALFLRSITPYRNRTPQRTGGHLCVCVCLCVGCVCVRVVCERVCGVVRECGVVWCVCGV